MKIKLTHILFVVVAIAVALALFSTPKNQKKGFATLYGSGDSYVFVVYSDTCPHCHHLLDYLSTLNINVNVKGTKDSKYAYQCLSANGFSWNFGVPIMFAKTKDGLIVIQGYPSSSQDSNGYFVSKEYEYNLCNTSSGTPFYDKNGDYLFCKMPDGRILGNKYAVDYLLSLCAKEKCENIC